MIASSNKKGFQYLFINVSKIALNILVYLNEVDATHLGITCKVFNSKLNELLDQNFRILHQIWDKESASSSSEDDKQKEKQSGKKRKDNKNVQKPQKPKKIDNNILKENLFELSPEFIAQIKNWKLLNPKEINSQNVSLFQDKFIKENTHIIFGDTSSNKIIAVNRSLLDNSLNMECTSESDKSTKYNSLFESEKFSSQSYDFSNIASLMERQKEILNSLKNTEQSEKIKIDNLPNINSALSIKKITIILCQGGYFAIAVYDKNKCIVHKSDHKYVVRKKAGQRQITRDSNSGSSIQSMGSQIRRANEKKHQENIKKILNENFKVIEDSDLVLFHAPGFNKYLILDEGDPTYKIKHKFRSICMTTKKANYTEIERVYKVITKVYTITL